MISYQKYDIIHDIIYDIDMISYLISYMISWVTHSLREWYHTWYHTKNMISYMISYTQYDIILNIIYDIMSYPFLARMISYKKYDIIHDIIYFFEKRCFHGWYHCSFHIILSMISVLRDIIPVIAYDICLWYQYYAIS